MKAKKTSEAATRSGVRVNTRVRAGKITVNHSQAATGLRVKTRVKAGLNFTKICFAN